MTPDLGHATVQPVSSDWSRAVRQGGDGRGALEANRCSRMQGWKKKVLLDLRRTVD